MEDVVEREREREGAKVKPGRSRVTVALQTHLRDDVTLLVI
jgi:hypothetical protein